MELGDVSKLGDGQVLLRMLYLSLDFYMRGRMSSVPSYAAPAGIGDVMVGGTVSRVEVSHRNALGRQALAKQDALQKCVDGPRMSMLRSSAKIWLALTHQSE